MTQYFPFLKAKRGEYRALAGLDPVTRSRVVPVLELLPPPKPRSKADRPAKPPPTVDKQVRGHVRAISQASSTCHPVLLDFSYLPPTPTSSGGHPAAAILAELLSLNVLAAPVLHTSAPLPLLRCLQQAGCMTRGLMLRLGPADFDYPPEHLDVILSTLHVPEDKVDAVIDFGVLSDGGALQRGMMRAALESQKDRKWRSLTIGGGSFPTSLKDLEEGEHRFPRLEWSVWQSLGAGRYGFADYGMRDPSPPIDGGTAPIPNLRYTDDDHWLVLRAKASEPDLYTELATSLVKSATWSGDDHCAGCLAIKRCADGDRGRTAEQAIQAGMIHHITCVTQQLAN